MKNKKMFKSSMFVTATMLVLVSCGGNSKTETGFKVNDKNKDNYTINSVFDNDNGIEATAIYSDGSQTVIPKGSYSYSVSLNNQKVDTSKAFGKIGTYTCVVTYKDTYEPVTYNFIINNEQKEVTKIEIASSALKTEFEVGDTFSSSGLRLKVTYKDSTTSIIGSGYTTDYDGHEFLASEIGSQTVTVTYSTKTTTYGITVKEATPTESYSYTFTKKAFSGDGSYELNGINWNVNSGVTSFGYDTSTYGRGQQIGSKNDAAEILTLSTNDFAFPIKKVKVVTSGGQNVACTFSVSIGGSAFGSSFAIIQTNTEYTFEGSASGEMVFTWNQTSSKDLFIKSIYVEYDSTPIPATDITVNPSSLELGLGKSKTLSINYTPSGATTEKEVTWKSSNPTAISVDASGVVSTTSTAKAGDTAVITATLVTNQKTSTCSVTVVEQKQDAYTVMIYMSGNDLESDSQYSDGAATNDITEMLKAVNQPDDVNVIIQTGGCSKWKKYNIPNNKLGRYHIENKQLVQDTTLTNASMGLTSTFQSFVEWGINEYPADKMSLILWNHGGAMQGVCYDENYSEDPLLASEVCAGMKNAFASTKFSGKFEWIGYDACLMGVQDIATVNADYFNYMISSQESEGGDGWEYTTWLNSLFATPSISTPELGEIIIDSFGASSYYNDWTLSLLDLSQINDYITAFNNLANQISQIASTSTKWKVVNSVLQGSLQFGYSTGYGYVFDVFDTVSFMDNLAKNSLYSSCDFASVKTALNKLVACNKYGSDYTTAKPCGICTFAAVYGYTAQAEYTTGDTKLTAWRNLLLQDGYGTWYNG